MVGVRAGVRVRVRVRVAPLVGSVGGRRDGGYGEVLITQCPGHLVGVRGRGRR